jgi:hypothetical protein
VEQLDLADPYDLAIVVLRRNQIPSVPVLAQNHRIPSVLFLGNNAAGSEDLTKALGHERVLIGMPNAGGAREGHVVRYLWSRWMPLLFGAFREALGALRKIGVPLRPVAARLLEWLPEPILAFLFRLLFDSRLAEMGAQPHMNAAWTK